jgi:hypothetical protein
MPLTCLRRRVSPSLRVRAPGSRHRHHRVCGGLLGWPLVDGARAHLQALARHGPAPLASQHDRRRLGATSWWTTTGRWWCADQALQAFPPPAEGLLSRVGDRTLKGARGRTPPVAQQPRRSQHQPDVCGVRLVRLLAPGDVSRLPGAGALVRRTPAPADQPANARCRQLRPECRRPAWGQGGVVTAEAASASRAHVALRPALGDRDVVALPRPWKFAQGTARNALVTPRPRWQDRQMRLPTVNRPRRRTCGVSTNRARWRPLGAVTAGLRTGRRHEGPKQPQSRVTQRPELVTAREMVGVSRRRRRIAWLGKELTGVVGLGQPQVTQQVGRVERARAVARMA